MTRRKPSRAGELDTGALPEQGRVVDFLGAVVPARAREVAGAAPEGDLSNVVPFAPRRRSGADPDAPALAVSTDDRPAPLALFDRRERIALLIVASLAVHASVFAAFNRAPAPLASIGVVSIDAELVLGGEAEAGHSNQRTESELSSAASPVTPEQEAPQPETAREADQAHKAEPEPVQSAKTQSEAKPEPAEAMQQPTPQQQPELAAAPKPVEKPTETPRKQAKLEEPSEAKPAPKPRQETQKTNDKGKNERTRAPAPSTASLESNSVGRGRSDADSNYRGIVAAHLARYKQFPADARGRGDQGTATVTFSLDGSGRVTSAHLARGSGVASLDQETQAMVRRASPFPAPPTGRPMTFTVPISFYLR